MATPLRSFSTLLLGTPVCRWTGLALLALCATLLSGEKAAAQISAETLIGDAVSDADSNTDVTEAIKRYANKDVIAAKQFLETAKRKDDRLPPVNLMMAKLYFLSRQTQAGLAALEATARENPEDPEPYLLLADQAINSQQAISANALYDKAIQLTDAYDKNPRRKRKFIIRSYAGRSAVLQRWQEWAGAEADLRKWIEADPEDANAYNRLGFVLFMQGREKDGYEAFKKSKDLNGDMPSPFVSAATMYQRLSSMADSDSKKQEYDSKAEQSFARAYQNGKDDLMTLITYGEWLIRTGKMDKAAEILAAARQAQPSAPQIQLLSGVLAQMTGDTDAAEKYYVQTQALSPGNRDANNQLALMLIASEDAKDKSRAEAIARNNAQLNENNADVNITLAWVLRQTGKGAEANEAYQKGIRLGALSSDSKLLVAKLLIEQKRDETAKGLLQDALRSEQGTFVNRDEAEALLESLN